MPYDIADFQHNRDSSLASMITSNVAADRIINVLHQNGLDRAYNYIYRSCCPELTPSSNPSLLKSWAKVCDQFGLSTIPKLYVTRDYRSTVAARGIQEPFLVFSSEYLRKLDEETQVGVLAGQAAAIRCRHQGLMYASSMIPAASLVVEPWINDWKRGRFFTYDQAFCLATNDRALALRNVLLNVVPGDLLNQMRFGTSNDTFLDQANRFVNGMGMMQSGIKRAVSMLSDKDWLPERYLEIIKFCDGRGIR